MSFDYDLFVIGGGSGGVRAARLTAQKSGQRVGLAEDYRVGGTCVVRGCVPKKIMAYAANHGKNLTDAMRFGWQKQPHHTLRGSDFCFDWPGFQNRLANELDRLEGLYQDTLKKAGVTLYKTRARLHDAHTVVLADGRTITAKHILIATGSTPIVPSVPGQVHASVSNDIFLMRTLPKTLLVVGGGYIACEMASILNGLGVQVTQLYRGECILKGFDKETAQHVQTLHQQQGIALHLNTDVLSLHKNPDQTLTVHTNHNQALTCDSVLFATGRCPNTRDLGLAAVGVHTGHQQEIIVDGYSQTNIPSIYAVGDVTNRRNLTPVAIRESTAFVNTVFMGRPERFDHTLVASAIFTNPEMASIGLSEETARTEGRSITVYKKQFLPMDKHFAERTEAVFMKLIAERPTGRILGCHIVSANASELIQLVAIALHMGAGKDDFDAPCAVHPTLAEELITLKNSSP